MREQLEVLRDALLEAGDWELAQRVTAALSGNDQSLNAFLTSNDLWGGSGSVADQGGIASSHDSRRRVQSALVALGEAQMSAGVVNPRTESWVEAFRSWERDGI